MIVFLFLSICPYATAQDTAYQCDGTIGRDFWLMFLDNRGDQTPHQTLLNIIGDTSATINVFNPSTNWSTSATLNAFQSVQISVPTSSSSCTQSNTMQTKNFGLHVTSTTSVSVTATNHKLKCNDMALIYPTHMLGTHYIMQDFPGSSQHSDISNAVVGFVATRDNTTLTMVLPCNLIGNSAHAGDTLTVNLMQGQSYQLIASPSSSFSGMEVTSNGKPFAAFQGNRAAYIPTAAQGADLLYEQALPVDHWGTDYVVVPTYGRSGDQVRITSAEDNCQLYRDGTLLATLQKGDTHEENLNATKRYTATGKIAVGRYLRSNSSGGSPGDPASAMIPPAGHGSQHIRFATRTESEFSNHYVNIVAPNSCVPGITLDGSNIANHFTQLDNSYSYATCAIQPGTHLLESPQGNIVTDLYGLGNVAGYATVLAYSICRQPEPESLCNGQGRDFWATFLCNDDDPASALSLIATGAQQASVTVTNPVTGWTQTASMPAGGKVQINLPVASTIPSGQTHNIGYHITSTAPVTLYACNFKEGSWDFAQVFPTFAIGDNYIVQNYTNNSDHPANVAFVATENGTSLSMVLPCTVTGLSLPAGSQYTATLDSGQSLMLRANPGGDFSGMEVSSNCKPFALFQGCAAGRVGDNGTNSGRDHFFEQALSPVMWGTEFVADASLNRSEGDRVVVTAGADNCTVQINGSIVATLMRGQSHEHTLASNTTAHIITSQPAYACLYLVSYHNGGTRGDPGAATLPPVNRWVCHSDFMLHQCNNNLSSQYYIANPYINIIAENTAVGTLALDGTVIPASLFSPIAGTSFSHTRKNIDYGAHTLDGGDAGTFSARAYGLGQWVGFAYNIDMLVDTMERCLPQLHHDTITYSDSVCMGLSYLSPMEIVCGNTTYLPPSGLIYVPSSETAQPGTLQRWSDWVEDDTLVHHICLTLTVLPETRTTISNIIIAGDTLFFADTAITLAGTYTFRYARTGQCDSVVTLVVSIQEASLAASADGVCPGEEVVLTGSGSHVYNWSATPPDTTLAALQGQNPISVHPQQTTTYTLLDAGGGTIASITVGVEPPPALCVESNRSFIDFDHPILILKDCSPGHYRSEWNFSDGARFTGEQIRHRFAHPLPDSFEVTLTSCNRYQCCADTTLVFPVEILSVWFPNIFFPDAGENNRFHCHTSYEVADFELTVYNRQGLLVWETTDIDTPWDGTHGGTPVPQGAYVYRWYLKDIHGHVRTGLGTVTLVR